ncbi:MAG: hypothetical protein GX447_02915 [Elusimicrobia bacterium]|nr:hypothetical protein [Elusimicrobiota bacterium]
MINLFLIYHFLSSSLNAQVVSTASLSANDTVQVQISSDSVNIDDKEKEPLKEIVKICEKETDFKKALIELRLSIQEYLHKNYRPPKDLEELFPLYSQCKPKIKLGKDFSYSVYYVRTSEYDRNYKQAVNGSSAYIYFSDPQSIYFGLILLNSSEKSPEGIPYYLY